MYGPFLNPLLDEGICTPFGLRGFVLFLLYVGSVPVGEEGGGGGTDVGSGVQRRQRDWRPAVRSPQRSPAAACSARCMRGGRPSEQYSFIRANPS